MPALLLPSLHDFSLQAALPQATSPTATTRTALVFGWDDVLCPSSWLAQTSAIHPNQLAHPALGHQLSVLDDHIRHLVTQAMVMGPVVIVANDVDAMHRTCGRFFPLTLQLLSSSCNVRVVGTEPNVLDRICAEYLQVSTSLFAPQTTLVVVGGPVLRQSCLEMAYAPLVVAKVVTCGRRTPSVDEVRQQVHMLGSGLMQIVVSHTTGVDMLL
ncbi:hypothetical protein ACHHYP_11263 [Achlya hypogyna]|uniref:Uncharacterized protein n=1 Tax=Achlya hypogyna TaxID=1202772 RepID=A0A1V9YJE5_ACHHY|nr:hypothetical protein ACHHYP_11263 [Achlya hypogyna]